VRSQATDDESSNDQRPVIAEVEARVLAVGAAYLEIAIESVLDSASLALPGTR